MKRILVFMVVAGLGALGAAGCGEREQTALYKDGKYRGKPDGRPWESAEAGWNKGDRAGWQKQVRARNESQNENRRIGH
jgi:hypothetical protein